MKPIHRLLSGKCDLREETTALVLWPLTYGCGGSVIIVILLGLQYMEEGRTSGRV